MTEYVAAGANRHPATADWHGDTLAYGTDRNIAIWNPESNGRGVTRLLTGHTDAVNAVKFLETSNGLLLITGSVDKTVKIWRAKHSSAGDFECVQTLVDHQNSINCISVYPGKDIFATGSADVTVKIWRLDASTSNASLVQSLTLKPRFFPLALALSPLNGSPGSYILAVAGTTTIAQLYIADAASNGAFEFKLKATLTGHEGWIRSLAFTYESDSAESDLLLSSASQDKYIRLWRVHQGKELPAAAAAGSDPASGAFLPGKSLSNKAHRFVAGGKDYTATFEALLLGHDDWVYSTVWKHRFGKLQLLSASADNSLSIWEQDLASSIWVSVARLGEISSTKGSTTATGSTGGFWTGLWSPDGQTVTCLGRTGSWRVWHYDEEQDQWKPTFGVGGHTRAVTGIAWSKKGDYLLSTSSDQTTRLHARWKRADKTTWHEMARPQIHGYDLNCIDSLGESQFVSGADEKLLRIFDEPRGVASLLLELCGIEANIQDMRDAANMPVLGLSNKAIDAVDNDQEIERPNENDRDALDPGSVMHKSTLIIDHPPLEDHLSRNTLWPEIEKLYGHGYEISTLATSHDGSVIATACKASSIDHAVIRLFGTQDWVEVKPPLTAHSLTVTRLRFSHDDKYLLSVGRDRQWAIFQRAGAPQEKSLTYQLKESNLKGHSRMILDAAWAPSLNDIFATAGRDKQVKLWRKEASNEGAAGFVLVTTIPEETPVTSIDFMDREFPEHHAYLAVGTEAGKIVVYSINLTSLEVTGKHSLEPSSCPSQAISQLAWRPLEADIQTSEDSIFDEAKLAASSDDNSLRVFSLRSLLDLK